MQELETWLAAHPRTGLAVILVLVVILAGTIFRSRLKKMAASARTFWHRVKAARKAADQAWRDSSSKHTHPPVWPSVVQKSWRWLADHLVHFAAWLLLLAAAWMLAARIRSPTFNPEKEDLVLLGLILVLAFVAQLGSALLLRLKKVGPVEFVEERFDRILPELKEWSHYVEIGYVDLETSQRPSARLLWEYTKAETFVTHLEWSGIETSGLKDKEKFHDLLFKMSMVAMLDRRWAPALNWLELLLKVSDGKFKAVHTHYRCGIACWKLAELPSEKAEKVALHRKAQDHLVCATEDRHFHQAYFNLAYVEFLLQEYELALENNRKAVRILPGYAHAKYNGALCFLRLGKLEEGLEAVKSMGPSDKGVETVAKYAFRDEDLRPLLSHPRLGAEARRHLDTLIHPAGSTSA